MQSRFQQCPQLCYRSSRYQTKIVRSRIICLQSRFRLRSLALRRHRYLQPVLYWTSRSMHQHYLSQ
ncbi:hypothetical protein NY2A_b049R [Paramecium bursaria Chlorella virus NY2A]|uniref:Uncharacterized protein b049R n=1 Tax=Paramecium bursaria Chlorella virus NY2A TaxID=46021 RepID=A7IVS4_PBCVN|nr:hypothetical protein NY2A_b049R [Paramecium bursaria Chlorella virus NY2A]ABT14448.1 hypothetical protein NY2A_b049R [Paramecium bursaria Chlorella virus NY2A]